MPVPTWETPTYRVEQPWPGGLVITRKRDGATAYLQPGDDSYRLLKELEPIAYRFNLVLQDYAHILTRNTPEEED